MADLDAMFVVRESGYKLGKVHFNEERLDCCEPVYLTLYMLADDTGDGMLSALLHLLLDGFASHTLRVGGPQYAQSALHVGKKHNDCPN